MVLGRALLWSQSGKTTVVEWQRSQDLKGVRGWVDVETEVGECSVCSRNSEEAEQAKEEEEGGAAQTGQG